MKPLKISRSIGSRRRSPRTQVRIGLAGGNTDEPAVQIVSPRVVGTDDVAALAGGSRAASAENAAAVCPQGDPRQSRLHPSRVCGHASKAEFRISESSQSRDDAGAQARVCVLSPSTQETLPGAERKPNWLSVPVHDRPKIIAHRSHEGQPSYQPGPGDMSQDTAKNRTEEPLRRAIEAGIRGYCAARRSIVRTDVGVRRSSTGYHIVVSVECWDRPALVQCLSRCAVYCFSA
jgi:hypothetical protein